MRQHKKPAKVPSWYRNVSTDEIDDCLIRTALSDITVDDAVKDALIRRGVREVQAKWSREEEYKRRIVKNPDEVIPTVAILETIRRGGARVTIRRLLD